MIWTHVRIKCVWYWKWISMAVWGKLPHIVTAGVTCTGIGVGIAYLPERPAAPPPRQLINMTPYRLEFEYIKPNVNANAPEPWSLLVLSFGIATLIYIKSRRR